MAEQEEIFIVGASGHAKVVIDIVEKQGLYRIGFLVDDNPELKGRNFFGYEVIGGRGDLCKVTDPPRKFIVGIGDNDIRREIFVWSLEQGFEAVSAIHPGAILGRGVSIGSGTVVMSQVTVNPDCLIGNNVIVNTNASVDHDCSISDHVHVAPGATLCGTVTVGEGAFVCAGATVAPNLNIGHNATVGAGAAVIRDVPDNALVVGCPAKPV